MKKQLLSLLLVTSLVTTVPVRADDLTVGKVIKTTLKGAWQVIKMGGGLCIMVGGVAFFAIPCACGCAFKILGEDSEKIKNFIAEVNEVNKEWGRQPVSSEDCKSAGTCCMATGLILGLPITYGGYRVTKSGVCGLAKMISDATEEELVAE